MTSPSIERLESALTPAQRDALLAVRTDAPALPDAAAEELASACGLIDLYVGPRSIATPTLQGWAVDIAAYKTGVRLGANTADEMAGQKAAHDNAIRALEAVRDSKFEAAAPNVPTSGSGQVVSGGRTNIFA